MKTHVLAVLDHSGSMAPYAGDVRGGFNAYRDELRADTDTEYTVTIVVFASSPTVLCVDTPLADAPQLDTTNYRIGGNTALNDAVMTAILQFEERHPELGDDERAILVVHTDGHENSSREFRAAAVGEKLTALKDTGKWTDVFFGAGPDAWNAGDQYGTGTISIQRSAGGFSSSYAAAAAATKTYASGGSAAETFSVAEQTVADLGAARA